MFLQEENLWRNFGHASFVCGVGGTCEPSWKYPWCKWFGGPSGVVKLYQILAWYLARSNCCTNESPPVGNHSVVLFLIDLHFFALTSAILYFPCHHRYIWPSALNISWYHAFPNYILAFGLLGFSWFFYIQMSTKWTYSISSCNSVKSYNSRRNFWRKKMLV